MGKLKKILCCMMAGIMLACTVPTAVTGLPAAKEVQAAVSVPTPSHSKSHQWNSRIQ